MFNALDHLNGLQLLLVLAPIVLIMTFIRKREEKAMSITFEDTNDLQQGWVFLSMLTPGLAASMLNLMSADEQSRLIGAGEGLKGSADRIALPVMDVFFKAGGLKGSPSKDVNEVLRFLNLKYKDEPKQLLTTYRKAYL